MPRSAHRSKARTVTLTADRSATDVIASLPRMDLPMTRSYPQACGLDLPVAVINLAHRPDRWEAISRRMTDAGLDNLIKAPAVEGARLSDAIIARFLGPSQRLPDGAPESHLSLTRPAIGCFLSHLAVWRWVIASGVPRALVLEDDACPTPGYTAAEFRDFVVSLTPKQGLVFPGCLIMEGLADVPTGADRLAQLHYFNGTFSYLITPQACRFLLDRILPLKAHIDHQLSSLFIQYRAEFQASYANPPFFAPDWSLRSDCYVPLKDIDRADMELGDLLRATRQMLTSEGHQLLPLLET